CARGSCQEAQRIGNPRLSKPVVACTEPRRSELVETTADVAACNVWCNPLLSASTRSRRHRWWFRQAQPPVCSAAGCLSVEPPGTWPSRQVHVVERVVPGTASRVRSPTTSAVGEQGGEVAEAGRCHREAGNVGDGE